MGVFGGGTVKADRKIIPKKKSGRRKDSPWNKVTLFVENRDETVSISWGGSETLEKGISELKKLINETLVQIKTR